MMTQTYADQTNVRSILDRASMTHDQTYRNDGNRNQPTEDDSSGVRAND